MATKFPANATAVADEFAKIAAKYFAKAGVTPTASATSDTKTYVINNVPAGYYLVKDKDSSLNGSNSVYTKYLLDVVGPSTINVKVGETTLDKTVSNTENGNYTEGVQANVGDTVYFELTATLPEYTSSYKTFKLKFTDTLSAGLTFGSVVSAKITDGASETTLTENTHYTLDKSGLSNNGGGTFVLETKDLKGIDKNLQFGDKVVIKYSATLNSNAVIGGNGNLNTAVLNYTNNPYDESTSTPEGTTPQNNAFVFTYNLDATKIDKADENKDLADALKLGGAEFIVYKEVTTEGVTVKHYATKVENNVITEWTPATSYASEELAEEAAAKFVSADSTGLFKVGGLASGTYFLKETKAPSGYNKLTAPIKFQIIAQVESNTSADTASTKSLSIDISNKVTNSADKTNVTATIVNGQGTTLPTTGGIGTTVFYVIGAFLILGASIMFIVKKRTSLE
jgi:fimbrial isopeptide formation D2 family protein/LPXTG-motif cell wall-anchored protein